MSSVALGTYPKNGAQNGDVLGSWCKKNCNVHFLDNLPCGSLWYIRPPRICSGLEASVRDLRCGGATPAVHPLVHLMTEFIHVKV